MLALLTVWIVQPWAWSQRNRFMMNHTDGGWADGAAQDADLGGDRRSGVALLVGAIGKLAKQ